MQIWSERDGARAREIAADIATVAWVTLWTTIGLTVFGLLSGLAAAGRLVRDGGLELIDAGDRIGGALEQIPLVGGNAGSGVRDALDNAAAPLIEFGTDLERVLIIMASLLAVLVAAVGLIPWLGRYLPWRIERLRRLNAAARVIRRRRFVASAPVAAPEIERLLASRAIHRLEYDQLLEFTPDPFGDWASGRHDRLASAELAGTGLSVAAR
jgi:hypothetical protein